MSTGQTREAADRFERLYRAYRGLMFYTANTILQDEQDAEDAVQQAFLKIAGHMDKVGDPDSPRTRAFLVTIAENKAIDLYRKRKRQRTVELSEELPGLPVVCEGENRLTACILKLPARYREAILLRYHQGYSVKEMAAVLGLSLPAASKLDQRAKTRLRELYEKEGEL